MADIPTFDGEKNKSIAREMLGTVDRSSIQTKIVKSKTADGLDKETRLRTRAGENEFVTTVSAPEDPAIGPVGGFILSPSDGDEDPISPQPSHVWDKAFFKTTDYEPPARVEKLPLLERLKKRQKNTSNKLRLHTKRKSAHVTWTGSKTYPSGKKMECVVSWDHGIKSRYRLHRDQDCSGRIIKFVGEEPECAQSGAPNVYVNGVEVETKYTPPGGDEMTLNVVGAAVFKDHLIFMAHRDLSYPTIDDAISREDKIAAGLANSTTVTLFYYTGSEWKLLNEHHAASALKAPWFFKPDGSRASSVRETTSTNQWLMHIDLSEDEAGNLTSTFSETVISTSVPFYVDTTGPFDRTTSSGETGWQTPGEWSNQEYGNLASGYGIGPRAGSTVAGTFGLANELKAHADGTGDPGTPYRIENYRVADGEAGYATATANKSVGQFLTWEIYTLINSYNNVRGSVAFRAFRDTKNIFSSGGVVDTYVRKTEGFRTLAVDYGFDGGFLIVTEELKSIGTGYSTEAEGKNSTEYKRPDYDVETIHSVLDERVKFTVSGNVEWQVKINGEKLFSISGGVDDGGVSFSEYTRKYDVTDASSTDVITGYQLPTNPLHVERGWLIDLDARSKSCIYEKLRQSFTPIPLDTTDTSVFRRVFPSRFMAHETSSASLHLINNGIEEYVERIDLGTLPTPTMFRPYALMMQLVPRFHDLKELLEEESILQMMEWSDGSALLEAIRYFYISIDSAFDPMPRGGPGGDREGQLQSRNIDQTIFSTATRTTAQFQSNPLAEIPITKVHDVTYTTRAYIRDEEYPLLAKVVEKLSDDSFASDYSNPRSSLRLNPIFST